MTDNHGTDRRDKPPGPNSGWPDAAPLVSVVVPTFRRPKLLELSLRSVRAQTHRPLQVIVVDDDDDPATGKIVESTLAGVAGLEAEFLRQPNRGSAAARNRGLAAARGEFVQFLDDDDTLFPDKIAEQAAFLTETRADAVFGDWVQGQDMASARGFRTRERSSHFVFLAAEGWVPAFAYLARTQSCRGIGGWNVNLHFNDDFDFFLRLAASGARFRHQSLRTGFYRWHAGPRVSAEAREARTAANIAIFGRVEQLRRERGRATPEDLRALLAFWRKIATEAKGEHFDACRTAIGRLRGELGLRAGPLEDILGPERYYGLRAIGGPLRWARSLAHRILPLSARRAIRRWENGLRAALTRALWKA